MPLVAGVDIGNSTTEIVICDGNRPVAWNRRPTRGIKGSNSSVQAASALLRSIERSHKISVDSVVVAPWKPVLTAAQTIYEPTPDTGHLQFIPCSQNSVAGDTAVCARPWLLNEPQPTGNLIALVPRNVSFDDAASIISANDAIVGVLTEKDEAVLIDRRVSRSLPIIDCVDTAKAAQAQMIFMEVRPAGQRVSIATDVWALTEKFGTDAKSHSDLARIANWVEKDRATVIGYFADFPQKIYAAPIETITWANGMTQEIFNAIDLIRNSSIGDIAAHNNNLTADLWAVDISQTANQCGINISQSVNNHARAVAIAELNASASVVTSPGDIFQLPITIHSSEAQAAAIGARTTPGISADALILDIGGGTIDLIDLDVESSAAGAGELLTHAVANVMAVPLGAADWIKRQPAQRLEAPQILLNEDGSKTFTESALSSKLMGQLITQGPSGTFPFGSSLQLAEWRILRQALKFSTVAQNIARLLGTRTNINLILVGGPAADDELLPLIAKLPQVSAVGRGNVAGVLGQRYSVAYGLTQIDH